MSDRKKSLAEDDVVSEIHGTHPLPGETPSDDVFSKTIVLSKAAADPDEAPREQQLQPGSLLRNRYVLKEQLTSGSMGLVFKALDRHMTDAAGVEAAVAIKVLTPRLAKNPGALRALQQEAAKGRYLSHPGIVRFIDLDRDDELYFIVMEWLEGQSLGEVLDKNMLAGDTKRALDIIRQIADALEYAHQRGVVHADIKPGNVMLLPDGSVKLIDFGIARVCQLGGPDLKESTVLKAATPAYSSMQVLTGETPVASDDVFSLACLAYRLISGHRVFGPRNATEAAAEGMEPQRPQGLSESQWSALKKGLSFARVVRQKTPRELVDGLSIEARVEPIDVAQIVPVEFVRERHDEKRRSHWPYLLVLLVIGVAAAYFFQPAWMVTGMERLEAFAEDVQRRAASLSDGRSESNKAADGLVATPAEPQALPNAVSDKNMPVVDDIVPDHTQPAAVAREATDVQPESEAVIEGTAAEEQDEAPTDVIADPSGPARLILAEGGRPTSQLELTLHEDGDAATIELERQSGLSEPLLVRVDEVGFSGPRSPGDAGEYAVSDDGVISFDAGQQFASLTINVISNEEREPDRQVSLRLRDYYDAESELAQIDLRLLDDDQRAYEANIPANAISFATDRSVVAERDPAVQIEVLRYNPDNNALTVYYNVRDVSASEDEDYFVPTLRSIHFGAGQRNARLLISLVQDNVREGDEQFIVELDQADAHESTISSVSVVIRDDDLFAE